MYLTPYLLGIVIAFSVAFDSAHPRKVDAQVRGDRAEATELARMLAELKVQTVADIGAGFGAFSALVAGQLGDNVQFIATELPGQMAKLSEGLRSRGVSHVATVEGAVGETKLQPGSCDAVIVRVTFHHFSQPNEMALSLARTLRPGGYLFVIEHPPTQAPSGEWDGIMPVALIEQLQKAGFTHERTVDPFNTMWRPPLYLLIMRRP